jgi:hypothetical protein
MLYLTIALGAFAFLEILNVIILYFAPQSNLGNGVGCFTALEKAKKDPEVYALVKYLVNWVAGTKLIFIALIIAILILGSPLLKFVSGGALILTIASFYWRLFPLIRQMDKADQIQPKGYSGTLGLMIAGFILTIGLAMTVGIFFP